EAVNVAWVGSAYITENLGPLVGPVACDVRHIRLRDVVVVFALQLPDRGGGRHANPVFTRVAVPRGDPHDVRAADRQRRRRQLACAIRIAGTTVEAVHYSAVGTINLVVQSAAAGVARRL